MKSQVTFKAGESARGSNTKHNTLGRQMPLPSQPNRMKWETATIQFNVRLHTVWIICQTVFLTNHFIGTGKTEPNYTVSFFCEWTKNIVGYFLTHSVQPSTNIVTIQYKKLIGDELPERNIVTFWQLNL